MATEWEERARRESRQTALLVLAGLVVLAVLELGYGLLTHTDRACPAGQYPVVGSGPSGRTGVCVAQGEAPPAGLHRYPRHKVPVYANQLYRPTVQDYQKFGSPHQRKHAERLAGGLSS